MPVLKKNDILNLAGERANAPAKNLSKTLKRLPGELDRLFLSK